MAGAESCRSWQPAHREHTKNTCLHIIFTGHPHCRLSLFGDPADYSSIAETLDGMPGVKAHGLLAGLVDEAAILTSAGLTFLRVRDAQVAES